MQKNKTEEKIEIDLKEILGILWHKFIWIILSGVIFGAIAFAISSFVITPLYESRTEVFILSKENDSTLTYSDVQLGTQLTKDYSVLIKSRYVLEQVMESQNLDISYKEFYDLVDVATPLGTRMIFITVTYDSAEGAQLIADEIRIVASEHIKNVMDIQAVNVADDAYLPSEPVSPNVLEWTLIGTALGMLFVCVIIILRHILDDTIKTADDVERYLDLSTLAVIPKFIENEQISKSSAKSKSKKSKTSNADLPNGALKIYNSLTELEEDSEFRNIEVVGDFPRFVTEEE